MRCSAKYISINGLRLHYIESGDENARPMILLHGTGDNAHIWDGLISSISKHFRTIALDQRGHGCSDWAIPPAYGCDDYVSDILEFVDDLQLEGIVLIGHSMGALHATRFASIKPQKVAGLIHVDIEPSPPLWNKKYLLNLYHTLPDYYASTEDFVRQLQQTSPFAEKDLLLQLANHALHEGVDGWLRPRFDKEVLRHFDQYDLSHDLVRITCPALIIRGEESRVMRRKEARQMNRMMLKSRLEEIPHATHPVHTDNPHAFQQAVFKFLEDAGLIDHAA
ncbi:MAG: alpha/beta hydrolase [Desulfobacteraceae bacterium]|nr:MAG: alpha/beta hydrolase [Desulfobacteraceae bacterium]